jgi:peroxiredoxin
MRAVIDMQEHLRWLRRGVLRVLPPTVAGFLRGTLRRSPAPQSRAGEASGVRMRSVSESRINRSGLTAGSAAPTFTLPDLSGQERSLADFRGRCVLLVFTDPTCKPCDGIAEDLVAVHEEHRSNELAVVAVSRGDVEANRAKAREHGFTFPVLLQKGWRVSKQYGIFATPVAYLVDERGLIAQDVAVGLPDVTELCSRLCTSRERRAAAEGLP